MRLLNKQERILIRDKVTASRNELVGNINSLDSSVNKAASILSDMNSSKEGVSKAISFLKKMDKHLVGVKTAALKNLYMQSRAGLDTTEVLKDLSRSINLATKVAAMVIVAKANEGEGEGTILNWDYEGKEPKQLAGDGYLIDEQSFNKSFAAEGKEAGKKKAAEPPLPTSPNCQSEYPKKEKDGLSDIDWKGQPGDLPNTGIPKAGAPGPGNAKKSSMRKAEEAEEACCQATEGDDADEGGEGCNKASCKKARQALDRHHQFEHTPYLEPHDGHPHTTRENIHHKGKKSSKVAEEAEEGAEASAEGSGHQDHSSDHRHDDPGTKFQNVTTASRRKLEAELDTEMASIFGEDGTREVTAPPQNLNKPMNLTSSNPFSDSINKIGDAFGGEAKEGPAPSAPPPPPPAPGGPAPGGPAPGATPGGTIQKEQDQLKDLEGDLQGDAGNDHLILQKLEKLEDMLEDQEDSSEDIASEGDEGDEGTQHDFNEDLLGGDDFQDEQDGQDKVQSSSIRATAGVKPIKRVASRDPVNNDYDLYNPGIDAILQKEILMDDYTNTLETSFNKSKGKTASVSNTKDLRLASASRKGNANSEDAILNSLVKEMFMQL